MESPLAVSRDVGKSPSYPEVRRTERPLYRGGIVLYLPKSACIFDGPVNEIKNHYRAQNLRCTEVLPEALWFEWCIYYVIFYVIMVKFSITSLRFTVHKSENHKKYLLEKLKWGGPVGSLMLVWASEFGAKCKGSPGVRGIYTWISSWMLLLIRKNIC